MRVTNWGFLCKSNYCFQVDSYTFQHHSAVVSFPVHLCLSVIVCTSESGGGQGDCGPPGPDQQPKTLLEITISGTILKKKVSASLHSVSN